jgi:hypothetical protein
MPNRADLMSAKGLSQSFDKCQTRTQHMRLRPRVTSDNLATHDIHGKSSCFVFTSETY